MSEYLNEDICQFSNDASASSFGWNFQANAGIFLFLKYMPDAADIKIESISQDIEITLIDERKVFAQAKSAQDSTTIKDQKEKFKDAIISLARNPYKDNQLVYISNIPDTFKSAPNFFNNSIIPYNDCLAGIQKEIDDTILSISKNIAKKIKKESDILVVIGIGGSYLGARAVIEALTSSFQNMLTDKQRKYPQILYVGNNLSPNYINELIEYIGDKDFSVNVISKSGTTTEPAIAFRIFREMLENKYGIEEARSRIYVTTDKERGALKTLADNEGYEKFVIPDNVGGRYSVLTPVGLLPIATAGIDIDKLMEGAQTAQERYNDSNLKYNECYKYAVVRNILYKLYKNTEILVNYEPKMHYFTEWWKQLYGESEGKEQKGIFPAGVDFTTDLHSMGQYIQEGRRNLFETVISIENSATDIIINKDEDNLDGLNYLAGKGLDYVNKKAMEGTIKAHV